MDEKGNEQDRGGSYWVFGHAGIHKQDQDKRKFWIIKALTNLFSKYAKKRSDPQLWAALWCCAHILSEQWSPISLCHIWSDSQFVLHCKAPIEDDSTCSSFWHLCNRMTKPHVQARHTPALLSPGEPLSFFVSHLEQAESNCVASSWVFCTKWELYVARGSQSPFCEDMDPWVHTDPPCHPPARTCYVGWWAQAERAWHGEWRRHESQAAYGRCSPSNAHWSSTSFSGHIIERGKEKGREEMRRKAQKLFTH